MPLSDQSSYGDKSQAWNRRTLGLPSGAGILLKAASGKEQEMVSGNTCYLSDLWYYQTVTCIALSVNRKWWLGAIFGVSVNLGPCYISVVFPSFCHCFFSVWECLIIHAADNWSLTLLTRNKGNQQLELAGHNWEGYDPAHQICSRLRSADVPRYIYSNTPG